MSQANSALHMSAMFPPAPQLSFPPNPFTQASPFAPFLPRAPAPAPAAAPVPIPAPALAAYQRASSCDEADVKADVSEQGSQAGEQLALENVSNASSQSGSPQSQSGPSPPPGAPHSQSPFAGASDANGASNPLQMLQRQLSLQSQAQQQHALRLDDASDAGGERRPYEPPPPHNSVGRGRGGGMPHRVSSADGCLSIVNYLMQFYLPSSEPEQFAKKVHFSLCSLYLLLTAAHL